jgi:hypothetical protein
MSVTLLFWLVVLAALGFGSGYLTFYLVEHSKSGSAPWWVLSAVGSIISLALPLIPFQASKPSHSLYVAAIILWFATWLLGGFAAIAGPRIYRSMAEGGREAV